MFVEYKKLLDADERANAVVPTEPEKSYAHAGRHSKKPTEGSLLEKEDVFMHSIEDGDDVDPNKQVDLLEAIMMKHIRRINNQEVEWKQHFLYLSSAAIVILEARWVEGTPRATGRLKEFRANVCGKDADNVSEITYEQACINYDAEEKALRAILSKENADDHFTQWQGFYYGSIRVRNVYLIGTTALLMIALFSGFIIQFFFQIFDPHIGALSKIVGLMVLPFGMVFFSVLGDELYDLSVDTFDYPTMPTGRATKLVALHYIFTKDLIDHNPERIQKWICWVVDWWGTYIMDAFCIGPALIMYCVSGTKLTDAAVCGGMVWAALTVVFFMVCDVAVNFVRLRKSDVTNPEKAIDMLVDAFETKNINQGQMTSQYWVILAHCRTAVQAEREADAERLENLSGAARSGNVDGTSVEEQMVAATAAIDADEAGDGEEPDWKAAKYYLACYFMIWVPFVIIFALVLGTWTYAFPMVAFVMSVSIFCLSKFLTKSMPAIVGNAYFAFLFLIGGLTGSLFLSGTATSSSAQAANSHTDPIMTINYSHIGEASSYGQLPIGWVNNDTTPYPVCYMSWGAEGRKLNIHDLSAMASYVYAEDEDDFRQAIHASYRGAWGLGNISILSITDYNVLPRWAAVKFHGEAGREDTIVIAVKGTSTTADAYADTSLYSMISVLQMFSHLSPVLSTIPAPVTSWFLDSLRLAVTRRAEDNIFIGLSDQVEQLQREHPNSQIVMTGHSLGGGISEAVGSRLGLQTVVFSAPGMSFSRERFSSSWMRTVRSVVGIVPETDAVPEVDAHIDMVQNIACRKADGTLRWFYECHFIKITACELWRACGDPRQRDFSAMCSQFVGRETLGGYFEHA